jgi:hypothetical protein
MNVLGIHSSYACDDHGFAETATRKPLPEHDTYPARRTSIDSVYGKVSFLASPLAFSNLTLPDVSRLMPYEAEGPEWSK